jgi:hypothetical protein
MDLKLKDEGNGGELIKTTNDLAVIDGFQNMVYLALFGGNVKASTPTQRIATEQDFSWWGNNLFNEGDESVQFNSETERALDNIALTSSGRVLIQQAVEKDLEFMQDFATVIVTIAIVGPDKIAIGVRVIEPDNLQKQDFIFIWNATDQELLGDEEFLVTFSPADSFDFTFDITFY